MHLFVIAAATDYYRTEYWMEFFRACRASAPASRIIRAVWHRPSEMEFGGLVLEWWGVRTVLYCIHRTYDRS
jgi:hypothetical protein